jgi:hypothetical protein
VRLSTIGILILSGWLLISNGCRTKPEPCDCAFAEEELTKYTNKYFEALEDKGNLRQQLKACQEKN